MTTKSRPPKDFVCPITGQIFCDPVTLETGQTYERKAIQDWLKRGNTTCPITRQPISTTAQLPKTNYVLKRLITSWKEQPKTNYVLKRLITSWKEQHPELAQECSYYETPRNSFKVKEIPSGATTPQRTCDFVGHRNTDDYINQRSKRFMQAAVSTSPTSVKLAYNHSN